jgi:hypothetical protein
VRPLDMHPHRSDQIALFVKLSEQFYDAVPQMRDFGDRIHVWAFEPPQSGVRGSGSPLGATR